MNIRGVLGVLGRREFDGLRDEEELGAGGGQVACERRRELLVEGDDLRVDGGELSGDP